MQWHRLFGLLLTDFFADSPFVVEVEKDLSVQQQHLDVVVLRKGKGKFQGRLPDGLNGLAAHNLITFKSHRQSLDDWAMKELIGHYVSYRKLVSPSPDELLPAADFRLYAVCARYPHNLAGQVPWTESGTGVYECRWGTDVIRVVVVGQLPPDEHNAPLHLFSAVPEQVRFGQDHYRRRSEQTSSLLWLLLQCHKGEGVAVSYTWEDFLRDLPAELAKTLTPEQRLELFKRLPAEERVKGLPAEVILKGLPREQIEEYLRQHGNAPESSPQKSKRSRKGRKEPKDSEKRG